MSRFRATDGQIDREISALERIAKVRLRRASAELNEIDRDLRELRKEKARRAARAGEYVSTETTVSSEVPVSES